MATNTKADVWRENRLQITILSDTLKVYLPLHLCTVLRMGIPTWDKGGKEESREESEERRKGRPVERRM